MQRLIVCTIIQYRVEKVRTVCTVIAARPMSRRQASEKASECSKGETFYD